MLSPCLRFGHKNDIPRSPNRADFGECRELRDLGRVLGGHRVRLGLRCFGGSLFLTEAWHMAQHRGDEHNPPASRIRLIHAMTCRPLVNASLAAVTSALPASPGSDCAAPTAPASVSRLASAASVTTRQARCYRPGCCRRRRRCCRAPRCRGRTRTRCWSPKAPRPTRPAPAVPARDQPGAQRDQRTGAEVVQTVPDDDRRDTTRTGWLRPCHHQQTRDREDQPAADGVSRADVAAQHG